MMETTKKSKPNVSRRKWYHLRSWRQTLWIL